MAKSSKLLIIGGVAAGPKAAARARRLDQEIEITILEQGPYISYGGCGLPYFISGVIGNYRNLIARTPKKFAERQKIRVLVNHRAVRIDLRNKRVSVLYLSDGRGRDCHYDKLILATGASPIIPALPGVDLEGVFALRSLSQGLAIKEYLEKKSPRRVVIAGGGMIGLEMAESFSKLGLQVTVVEKAPRILPGFDGEIARLVEKHLAEKGVEVLVGKGIGEIGGEADRVSSVSVGKNILPADLVLLAVGVRPEVEIAREAGLEIGERGAIRVNEKMETSLSDVYAAGDCVELSHLITGRPVWAPLGSVANQTGRVAGENAAGGDAAFPGVLGAAVTKVFDLAVGRVGLTSREIREGGLTTSPAIIVAHDQSDYYPGSRNYTLKVEVEERTGRLLGGQGVGAGIEKRINILGTAIRFQGRYSDLETLDLAYAPPFSPAIDGLITVGYVVARKRKSSIRSLDVPKLKERLSSEGERLQLIDVRTPKEWNEGHIPGALHLPLGELKERLGELDPSRTVVVYCWEGIRSLSGVEILQQANFKDVFDLSGGFRLWY